MRQSVAHRDKARCADMTIQLFWNGDTANAAHDWIQPQGQSDRATERQRDGETEKSNLLIPPSLRPPVPPSLRLSVGIFVLYGSTWRSALRQCGRPRGRPTDPAYAAGTR